MSGITRRSTDGARQRTHHGMLPLGATGDILFVFYILCVVALAIAGATLLTHVFGPLGLPPVGWGGHGWPPLP